MESGLNSWADYVVIGLYFVVVIVVGVLIGASIFASNIGSEHFVGLAGSGAASGIAVVCFEWGAVLLLLLLGWFFLPVYLTAQVYTIPEYLGRRFGGYRMRIYLTCVALSLYVLTKVSVDVYAGGVFIQQATGWNLYLSVVPLLILTVFYTVAGGLAAVVFTDAMQTVIMIVGAVVLAVLAYIKVGGIEALYIKYMEAIPISVLNDTAANDSCAMPRHDAFHIFRDPLTSDLPWPGVVIRATLASLWYWCAEQVIVQRALAARSMAHAQAATLLAGFLKLTPLFLIILPGMVSRVLYPDQVACADPDTCMAVCNNPSGCSNIAYPLLILNMAPEGMRGLLMAVMVAALMSSLTSVFNSASTVFAMDIWRKARPLASEQQLLLVGRIFVVVLVVVSLAWIPLIMGSQKGQLFMYLQAVTGYLAPPICAIFLLAIFVPRINETGAFWGVLAGQATGVSRLILDFMYPAPACGQHDTRPLIVSRVHFTYFSGIVLAVTAIVACLVSLTRPPQPQEEIENLTWWSLKREEKKIGTRQGDRDIKLSDTGHMQYVLQHQQDMKKSPADEEDKFGSVDNEQIIDKGDHPSLDKRKYFNAVVPLPWRYVLNAGACVLLALLAFLVGFFA